MKLKNLFPRLLANAGKWPTSFAVAVDAVGLFGVMLLICGCQAKLDFVTDTKPGHLAKITLCKSPTDYQTWYTDTHPYEYMGALIFDDAATGNQVIIQGTFICTYQH